MYCGPGQAIPATASVLRKFPGSNSLTFSWGPNADEGLLQSGSLAPLSVAMKLFLANMLLSC